jgi:hypothetical protein
VKPNATLSYITSSEISELRKLSKSDVVVLCGGTLDIARNDSMQGLASISRFVENLDHTNVVVRYAPHRFDLHTSSCVNKEVIAFNRKLHKTLKPYNHASQINLLMERDHFTKHGLHMNGTGKDRLSGLLASRILELFATQPTVIPITIPWKDKAVAAENEQKRPISEDSVLTCPDHQLNEEIVKHSQGASLSIDNEQGIVLDSVNSAQHSSLAKISTKNLIKCDYRVIPTTAPLTYQLNQAKEPNRVSSRQKKPPQTKSDDFLW